MPPDAYKHLLGGEDAGPGSSEALYDTGQVTEVEDVVELWRGGG